MCTNFLHASCQLQLSFVACMAAACSSAERHQNATQAYGRACECSVTHTYLGLQAQAVAQRACCVSSSCSAAAGRTAAGQIPWPSLWVMCVFVFVFVFVCACLGQRCASLAAACRHAAAAASLPPVLRKSCSCSMGHPASPSTGCVLERAPASSGRCYCGSSCTRCCRMCDRRYVIRLGNESALRLVAGWLVALPRGLQHCWSAVSRLQAEPGAPQVMTSKAMAEKASPVLQSLFAAP